MSEAYSPSDADTRTFGDQITRLLKDLKRPDLQDIVPDYIRDAIRYYSRMPFFFNQLDNTGITTWTASQQVPAGYTIRDTASDGNYYIFVNLVEGRNGSSKPSFTPTLFVPSGTAGIVFTAGQAGTTVDNQITWATVKAWPATNAPANTEWTQLSTIPATNQYTPPIDYVAPYLVELTATGLRYPLNKEAYKHLRAKDVIRPPSAMIYPVDWAWFQKLIYVWPYANGFYPITLSYYTAPFPPKQTQTSNFWTTTAELMVRSYAAGLIHQKVTRNQEAMNMEFAVAKAEFNSLRSQESEQQATGGAPSEQW